MRVAKAQKGNDKIKRGVKVLRDFGPRFTLWGHRHLGSSRNNQGCPFGRL